MPTPAPTVTTKSNNRSAPAERVIDMRGKMPAERWPYIKRFGAMKAELATWLPTYMELSQFLNPTRGFFFNVTPNKGTKIDHRVVLDGHARRACRTLASGMTSGLTSPSRPWFRLAVDNPSLQEMQPVQIWLDSVQKIMLDIFAKSNIYGCLHSAYEEIGTFGTACIFIQEDFKDVIRGRVFTAGEYFLSCGPDGRVNGFGRQFSMTIDQLVTEFGKENVSPSVFAQWKQSNTQQWVKVNMLIEVNDDRVPDRADFANMPWRCLYWEEGSAEDRYLRLEGYVSFPLLAPRWDTTTTSDVYGKGPGWDSLGDVKMLQKQQRDKFMAVDKVGNPPVQMDASVQGEFNSLPGGVTRSNSTVPNMGVRAAYEVRPDVNALREDIMETQKAISASMFADLFLMLMQEHGQMTAAEVYERQSEKLQILGPVLERLENELLNPLIERTFEICLGNNLLPPPPKELQGSEIKIKYVSILAQAQKMVGVTAVDQWTAGVGMTMKLDPEAGDILEVDEINREKADMLAIPQKMVASPERVAQKRKARADANAMAANLQAAKIASEAAKGGAGAVKDLAGAPMGQNSALDSTLAAITGR